MAHFLGIDIGTSSVKAILMDESGSVVGSASRSYPASQPQPLWSEQDPDTWWHGTITALSELQQTHPDAYQDTVGIGLSGQMHGAVVLDAKGKPLRPAILWNDGRAFAECAELELQVSGLGDKAGVPAMPGFTAPKLLWLEKHEPEIFNAIHTVVLPKDYVRYQLTRTFVTDMCDAAGTLWLDEAKRRWHPELVEASGLGVNQLPDVMEGTECSGFLSGEAADLLGLKLGIPVVAGGGDAAAGAAGIGAVEDGNAFISLGTSAQYFVATDSYKPWPQSLIHSFAHCVPARWFQMACMLNGASPLMWFAGVSGGEDIGKLLAETEQQYRVDMPTVYLPYLTGERTPHNNPFAAASFHQLTAATTREHMVQAVLEGVAFSLRDCQQAMSEAGTVVPAIGAIGGGSRSQFWLQIIADVLNRTVVRYRDSESGPALGAARLAQIQVSCATPSEVCHKPDVIAVIEPDRENHQAYSDKYSEFTALYQEYEKPRTKRMAGN
ncbi:xylulokinase [Parasalinivibrio latis]|uniref:xylulokinase n=1 Tax=Parasalinivibrio latis TaxID=2952610 RepID=UPI0030DE9383